MKILTYVLIGLLLAVSGYAGVQAFVINPRNETKIEALTTRVNTAESTLRGVETSLTISDDLSSKLTEAIDKIGDKGTMVSERVIRMERDNEEVRDLLSTPLPDAGCMLDDTCGAAGSTASVGASAGTVQAAPPGKVRGSP